MIFKSKQFYKGCSDITILPAGTTSPSTTENNSKPTPTDGPVQIYGKCGGIGYTGQIECKAKTQNTV